MKSWFRLGVFTEEDLHAVVKDLDQDGAAEALDCESGPVRTSPRLEN